MKMSITQALAELNLLDARINKAVGEQNVFTISYMNNTKVNGSLTIEEANKEIESSWQSVNDLITRRANIKSLIVNSNAKTMVEIGEQKHQMTVAEAIERKNSIGYSRSLLNKLKMDFTKAQRTLIQGNEIARAKAQQSLDTVLGKDGSKTPSESEISAIFDPVYKKHEYKLLDPILIEKKITQLETAIEDFANNVDYVLSTSNAITQIEV